MFAAYEQLTNERRMTVNFDREPLLFRLVPWFIGFVFIVVVLFWIVLGVLAYKGIGEIGEIGLRATVERLWCGPSGCK